MSKSTALKTVFQFLSLLLCLVLIPTAFGQSEELSGSIIYENGTYENCTISEQESIGENYIVHSINPSYNYLYLMPGDNETFNVSFRNEGSEPLNVTPKVMDVFNNYYNVDESWIMISPANVTVDPGIEQDFAISVNVPENTESAEYQTQIAFTDDMYPEGYVDSMYPDGYPEPQYINVMHLGISVPVRPKLELQTSYISDIMEPGKEYIYAVKIKNVAGKDVTIDPKVVKNDIYTIPYTEPAFGDDIIEISAPSTIKAGEITNMTIRVPVPENASGSYSAFIKLNADGKENDGSSPQISLSFMVNKQPSVPYMRIFNTSTTDPITLEISTAVYDTNTLLISPKKEMPDFEISLKCNSNPVNLTLVKAIESGSVYTQGYVLPIWTMEEDSGYASYSKQYTETYRVPGEIGAWELTILPKNTGSFDYSITVGESE